MKNEINKLRKNLDLCIGNREKTTRSVSIAYSHSGKSYIAGNIETQTHLLNYSSEQNVLMLSILNNDDKVYKIITMVETTDYKKKNVSPIVVKAMLDHISKTHTDIEYEVYNVNGEKIFESKNINKLTGFYKPSKIFLSKFKDNKISNNRTKYRGKNIKDELKKYSLQAITRNFPNYDSASGYGTAIITKKKNIYFGGQYSSPDNRLGYHSEIATIISALMNKDYEITHLGVVSSKFKDNVCNCCGICRQFISEINQIFKTNIIIYNFAQDSDIYTKNTIKTYLPNQWTSKK